MSFFLIVVGTICFTVAILKYFLWFLIEKKGKHFLYFFLFSAIGFLSLYINHEIVHKDLSDLGYATSYEVERQTVEIDNIIKEKGKETEYVISIFYGTTVISESVYNEYIGNENNTITIRKAEMDVYVGHTYPFGIETSFSGEESSLSFVFKSRFSWPWEESVEPFSEKEARELAESYLAGNLETNGSCHKDMSGKLKAFKETSRKSHSL